MANVNKTLFSVVRIEAYQRETGITQNDLLARATGFLYERSNDKLFLVTNKHVVKDRQKAYYPDFLVVYVRSKLDAWSKTKDIKIELYDAAEKRRWREVTDKRVDVAAVPIAKEALPPISVTMPLSHKDALPRSCNPTIGSQAVVLGFPKGAFYDQYSNFPIARSATIATPRLFAFNKLPCFLVDARLQTGMSGSPVVSVPRAIYDKDGKLVYDDLSYYLLGIFSAEWKWGNEFLGLNTVWAPELIEGAILEGD